MRRFHSYGPVKPKKHFCVRREELVSQCLNQIIGDEDSGHYFTIWAPRQTGKTWLTEETERHILKEYGDNYDITRFSVGVLRELDEDNAYKISGIHFLISQISHHKPKSSYIKNTLNASKKLASKGFYPGTNY